MPADNLLERARRIHAAHHVIDTHADIPTDVLYRRARGEERVLERLHLPGLRAGGWSAIVAVCGGDFYRTDDSDLMRGVLEAMDGLHREAEESPGAVRIVATASELGRARADGVLGMLPSLEGAGALRGSLGVLRDFYRLGLRALGITWNYRNELADGAAEDGSGGGLTRFGTAVVKELQRLGMLVDVSHLADAGVRDALRASDGPVIASHSNARAVCGHVRNLPDWAIEGIARSGGVVGVALFGDFIHPVEVTADRLVDHVDHLRRLAGIEHIALGPDYTHYVDERSLAAADAAAGIYSGEHRYPAGMESAAGAHAFTAALLRRGYDETECAAILGGNYLRVCRQVLG